MFRPTMISVSKSGELSPQPPLAGQFLRSGINVFQYKKREVTESARASIASQLERELKGAFAEVERRTGKVLASYVLFTNADEAAALRFIDCFTANTLKQR